MQIVDFFCVARQPKVDSVSARSQGSRFREVQYQDLMFIVSYRVCHGIRFMWQLDLIRTNVHVNTLVIERLSDVHETFLW